jgi:hypothetical protein
MFRWTQVCNTQVRMSFVVRRVNSLPATSRAYVVSTAFWPSPVICLVNENDTLPPLCLGAPSRQNDK